MAADDEAQSYFLASGGKATGPFRRNDLLSMLRNGDIARSDLVWNRTLAEWTPVSEAIGAAPYAPRAAPERAGSQAGPGFGRFETIVARNAVLLAGAAASAVFLFFLSVSLMGDSPAAGAVLLVVCAYLCWWAWLEQTGCELSQGRLRFPRRMPFWPFAPPLYGRQVGLKDLAVGEAFASGRATHGIVVLIDGRPEALLFDSAFLRDQFLAALRARGVPSVGR